MTPRYWPLIGGVESHVYEVARRLARGALDVTVLTTDVSGGLPTEEDKDCVHIRRVRAWPAQGDAYWAPDIQTIVLHGQWDLVHVQSYHTLVAPLAMSAAIRAHLPFVVTFHGGGHSSRLRHVLRGVQQAMLRPLLTRAARLIALTQVEQEYFRKRLRLPPDRVEVIPNGANLPPVSGSRPRAGTGTLIASIGRLERYKGHQRVIAALPHIIAQWPDIRLWIAGTGPYEAELRRLANRLGVAERVEIRAIPYLEREALARDLAGTSLVVLLSEFETQPIAILEALALGCPALVADTPGLRELAVQGWARAIPVHSSPEHVAEAVLSQLNRPLIPRGIQLPTWENCAAELLEVYSEIWTKLHPAGLIERADVPSDVTSMTNIERSIEVELSDAHVF